MVSVKRGVVVFGCAVAFAAAPLVVASPAAADCPWGTKPTRFAGVCISGAGGGAAAPVAPVPPQTSAGGPQVFNNPNGYDTVNGIPCTPEHYGVCYGLTQNP
ncbi:MAG TPA: hypothetical protein VHT50_05190 [Mycobacterium sp.]|jgi:hypothetical protein|nr:hypothetical protein [Mycobacterium sp.]